MAAKVLAIAATLVGALSALTLAVMLLASGANATPRTITQIKWLLVLTALVGIGSLAAAIWALVAGRAGLAAALGIAPLGFVIILTIVLVKLEW